MRDLMSWAVPSRARASGSSPSSPTTTPIPPISLGVGGQLGGAVPAASAPRSAAAASSSRSRAAEPLGGGDGVVAAAERRGGAVELVAALAVEVDRGGPGDGLDPADVRGARALGEDREDPDLGGAGDVGAAAELARDALDLDDADPVAVLLAEQRHRAEALGLAAIHLDRANRGAVLDPAVDPLADRREVLGAEPAAVGEVEAQLVGPDRRAGLADVAAEPLAERRVEEVGGGVVSHRRVAVEAGDLGLDAGARLRGRRPRTFSAWSPPTR